MEKRGVSYGKSAQVTAFIIAALFVVLMVFIVYVIYEQSLQQVKDDAQNGFTAQLELFPLDKYVEYCVYRELPAVLQEVGEHAGSNEFVYYRNETYPFFHTRSSGNQFVTAESVSVQVNTLLEKRLSSCMNVSAYEEQGFTVKNGSLSSNTTIGLNDITVVISYPLTVTKGTTSSSKDSFKAVVELPFGRLVKTASDIVNSEIETGSFDQQVYMHQPANVLFDSPLVVIEKHRPFPHVIYNLTLSYKGLRIPFHFAVEGTQSGASISSSNGCCYSKSNVCYKDVSSNECLNFGGKFISDSSCSCVEKQDQLALHTTTFSSCGASVSGSSWCEYTSGVGGRFYRKLCVDGAVLTEDCRDYREEVCGQKIENGVSVSTCRPNSGGACAACKTKDCCNKYDCQFTKDNVCVPVAAVGTQFWKTDVANSACGSYSASISAHDSVYCAFGPDCEQSQNYFGEPVRDAALTTRMNSLVNISIPISYSSEFSASGNVVYNVKSLSEYFTNAMYEIEQFSKYPVQTYLNPKTNTSIVSSALQCGPYFASAVGNCGYCDSLITCSEYACRSLGKNCAYSIVDGRGTCHEIKRAVGDLNILNVVDGNRRSLLIATIGNISGFELSGPVKPHDLLEISFQTDKPAMCKPTYLPYQQFDSVHSPDLSHGVFSQNHTLQIRFVNDLPVFDSFLSSFSVPDYPALMLALVDFKNQLDQLQRRYPTISKYRPAFYTSLSKFVDAYLDDSKRNVIDLLLDRLSRKNFAVFFSCVDESDNKLSQDTFVSFSVSSPCESRAPVILNVSTDREPYFDTTVFVQTDVLSDCRFDSQDLLYDQMNFSMMCAENEYDVSGDGVYTCSGRPVNMENIHVKCRNKVPAMHSTFLNVSVTENGSSRKFTNLTYTAENVEKNISVRQNSTLIIQYDTAHSCTVDDTEIACGLHSCDVFIEKDSVVSCSVLQTVLSCPTIAPVVSGDASISLKRLENLTMTVANKDGIISVYVLNSVLRNVSCALENGIVLRADGNDTFSVSAEKAPSLVRIKCKDSFGYFVEKVLVR